MLTNLSNMDSSTNRKHAIQCCQPYILCVDSLSTNYFDQQLLTGVLFPKVSKVKVRQSVS